MAFPGQRPGHLPRSLDIDVGHPNPRVTFGKRPGQCRPDAACRTCGEHDPPGDIE